MTNDDDDTLISRYTNELQREAELARGDLDEIEDHLRTLSGELRELGMPRAEAVAEACRRLGEPRAVAREHARVRSPFGARLSRVRAFSAAALMAAIVIRGALVVFPTSGVMSLYGLQLVFGMIMTLAIAARLTWARPVVLGGVAFFTVQMTYSVLTMPGLHPAWLLAYLGTLWFVMPWRRVELTASGLALALQVWAFAAAAFALDFQISTPDGIRYISAGGQIAFFAATLATCGGVLRARWSAVASAIAAITLGYAFVECSPLRFDFGFPRVAYAVILGLIGSGALAAAAGAWLSWRGARSALGTFAHVLA
jgi:hypothetical protein